MKRKWQLDLKWEEVGLIVVQQPASRGQWRYSGLTIGEILSQLWKDGSSHGFGFYISTLIRSSCVR